VTYGPDRLAGAGHAGIRDNARSRFSLCRVEGDLAMKTIDDFVVAGQRVPTRIQGSASDMPTLPPCHLTCDKRRPYLKGQLARDIMMISNLRRR
jgi:hypothetical protein